MINKMLLVGVLFNLYTGAFAQQNWDTTYYVSCKNRLSFGLMVSERSYNIDISADTGTATTINYDTEARNAIGFIADFDKLSLKILFKTKEKLNERKGNTRNSNFFIGFGSNKFLIEGSYRFFKGFYDETSGNYIPQFNDSTPYYKSSGMSANLIKAKVYFFNNHKRFAYKSVYSCGFRQLCSSYSGVLSANFMNERIIADSSMIPTLLQNEYGNASDIRGIAHTGFGAGAGLTGTLVFFKRFFANLLFVPSLHAQQRNYKYLKKEGSSGYYATLLLHTRLSIGFNNERFFILVTGTNDRHWIRGKGVNIQPSFISGTFIIGYRFNVTNTGWIQKVRASQVYKKI